MAICLGCGWSPPDDEGVLQFACVGDSEFSGGLHTDVEAFCGGELDDERHVTRVLGDDLIDALDIDRTVACGIEADDDRLDLDGFDRFLFCRRIWGQFIAILIQAAAGFLRRKQFGVVKGETVLLGALVLGAAAAQAEDIADDQEGLVFLVIVTPDHHLGAAGEVFEHEGGKGAIVLFGVAHIGLVDNARDPDGDGFAGGVHFLEQTEFGELGGIKMASVAVERVTADVEAEQFFFIAEDLVMWPLGAGGAG